MHTSIFILRDERDKTLNALEQQLQAVASQRFHIQPVASLEDLQEQLPKAKQAIVISTAKPPQLAPLMAECQSVLPSTSFITVCDNTDIAYTEAMWHSNCQFVKAPAEDFTLMGALSTANLQAALQSKILPLYKMDEVDNLLSRAYFMQRLSEELSMARRHHIPVSCVIISINFYRMYMDSYGYQFTTSLLHFVGDEANRITRHEDQVARLGDDEIALLMPHCNEIDAKKLIQRLIQELNHKLFQHGDNEEEISVCAGMAAYPLADGTPTNSDDLIRYARHALHQSKNNADEADCVSLFSEIRPSI